MFTILNLFCSLNLDSYLLLQPFCTKVQFLNGKAKQDITEKLAGKVLLCFACLFVYHRSYANSLQDEVVVYLPQCTVTINSISVVKFHPLIMLSEA